MKSIQSCSVQDIVAGDVVVDRGVERTVLVAVDKTSEFGTARVLHFSDGSAPRTANMQAFIWKVVHAASE